jgi:hypothetical protein
MKYYEVIGKEGTRTRYADITGLLYILTSNTNELIAQGIHVISIIDSESGSNQVDDWYFKPISESWNPESERKLEALSSEYQHMVLGNVPGHVWVLKHYNSEKIQELSYKLHITKDIDINEYREQLETISIEKVINHQDLVALLSESYSNVAF